MIQICPGLETAQPLLSIIRLFLEKGKVDQLAVTFLGRRRGNHVFFHAAEIVPCVSVSAGTQTLFETVGNHYRRYLSRDTHLEVFGCPSVCIGRLFEPLFIFRSSEEILDLVPFPDLERH